MQVPWGKPRFKFVYGPRGMFGGAGGIFAIEGMPFSAWGTKAKKLVEIFFCPEMRRFCVFRVVRHVSNAKTGLARFHGHCTCAL